LITGRKRRRSASPKPSPKCADKKKRLKARSIADAKEYEDDLQDVEEIELGEGPHRPHESEAEPGSGEGEEEVVGDGVEEEPEPMEDNSEDEDAAAAESDQEGIVEQNTAVQSIMPSDRCSSSYASSSDERRTDEATPPLTPKKKSTSDKSKSKYHHHKKHHHKSRKKHRLSKSEKTPEKEEEATLAVVDDTPVPTPTPTLCQTPSQSTQRVQIRTQKAAPAQISVSAPRPTPLEVVEPTKTTVEPEIDTKPRKITSVIPQQPKTNQQLQQLLFEMPLKRPDEPITGSNVTSRCFEKIKRAYKTQHEKVAVIKDILSPDHKKLLAEFTTNTKNQKYDQGRSRSIFFKRFSFLLTTLDEHATQLSATDGGTNHVALMDVSVSNHLRDPFHSRRLPTENDKETLMESIEKVTVQPEKAQLDTVKMANIHNYTDMIAVEITSDDNSDIILEKNRQNNDTHDVVHCLVNAVADFFNSRDIRKEAEKETLDFTNGLCPLPGVAGALPKYYAERILDDDLFDRYLANDLTTVPVDPETMKLPTLVCIIMETLLLHSNLYKPIHSRKKWHHLTPTCVNELVDLNKSTYDSDINNLLVQYLAMKLADELITNIAYVLVGSETHGEIKELMRYLIEAVKINRWLVLCLDEHSREYRTRTDLDMDRYLVAIDLIKHRKVFVDKTVTDTSCDVAVEPSVALERHSNVLSQIANKWNRRRPKKTVEKAVMEKTPVTRVVSFARIQLQDYITKTYSALCGE
jgi:hypothetical protein